MSLVSLDESTKRMHAIRYAIILYTTLLPGISWEEWVDRHRRLNYQQPFFCEVLYVIFNEIQIIFVCGLLSQTVFFLYRKSSSIWTGLSKSNCLTRLIINNIKNYVQANVPCKNKFPMKLFYPKQPPHKTKSWRLKLRRKNNKNKKLE